MTAVLVHEKAIARRCGAVLAWLAVGALAGCESTPPVADGAVAAAEASPAASAASAPASAPVPSASAPRPARSESFGYAIHWQRPLARAADDGVTVVSEGWRSGVRFVVTSSDGIGQVQVRPVRGGWPHRVQLQFQYTPGNPFEVLEGLRLQVVNPAHLAGDAEPPLVPDGFTVWQRDGAFWVDLPGGWLQSQQGLRIAWVDRYRQ